jgi:uncharacterized Zn finger protein (UPF0148 family)
MNAHPIRNDQEEEKASTEDGNYLSRKHRTVRVGELCPACEQGLLDYDGMLNLVCPVCGWTAGGCYT